MRGVNFNQTEALFFHRFSIALPDTLRFAFDLITNYDGNKLIILLSNLHRSPLFALKRGRATRIGDIAAHKLCNPWEIASKCSLRNRTFFNQRRTAVCAAGGDRALMNSHKLNCF